MSLKDVFSNPLLQKEYDISVRPVVDVRMICSDEQKPRLTALINRLAQSERGLEALRAAQKADFGFGFFNDKGNCLGVCDKADWTVTLNENASDDKLVGTLAHECRHAGQFIRGAHETFGKQDLKSEIIMFRAMEADAQANALAACYELAQIGDKRPLEFFGCPEITKPFNRELQNNGGVVTPEAMTAAFKGWYDQHDIKKAYERAYEVEPMWAEERSLQAGNAPKLLYAEPLDTTQTVKSITHTDKGSYFTDDPKILETGKYLDVTESTKAAFNLFFKIRHETTGMAPDPTNAHIPTRPNTVYRNPYSLEAYLEREREKAEREKQKAQQTQNGTSQKAFSMALASKLRQR